MYNILIFIHVLVCFALIGLVLLQRGKGSDIGAAFGSGASNTVFGSAGASDFLSKATGYLAALFFGLSLAMTYLTHQHLRSAGFLDMPAIDETASQSDRASGIIPVIPE
jgi:preprotein translocase subunit SecG